MKQQIGIFIICSLCFFSCSNEEIEVVGSGEGGANTLTVAYTIPDAIAATRAASYVEATGTESVVSGLHLFFFNPDEHGNGKFVASASATLKDDDLKQSSVTVTLPTSSVKTENEYPVLVAANLADYFTDNTALDAYLASFNNKTYGQVWEELQALLPIAADGTYSFPNGHLPMSGIAVKAAGKNTLNVRLLRAVVRIDAKVSAEATDITLKQVQLRNVAAVVPFFRTQEETSLPRASSAVLPVTGNTLTGGLYAIETSLNVSDNHILLKDATCLLVDVTASAIHTGADADKTWYRINLNVDWQKMQYLKRNNAYRIVITGVFALGSSTPDGAYNEGATLIDAVTIPTDWKTSGVTTPPDVVIQ